MLVSVENKIMLNKINKIFKKEDSSEFLGTSNIVFFCTVE